MSSSGHLPEKLEQPASTPLGGLFNLETKSLGLHLVQRCLGLSELQKLYRLSVKNRSADESFLTCLLRQLGVTWRISDQDLERIPRNGGVLVVANHPFGMIEGVVMSALLQQLRPDARVMANSLLSKFPELEESLILVNPFGGDDAIRANRRGLRNALNWLKQGGMLGVFPAGEVASVNLRRKQVLDPEWKRSVARLALLADVPVLPVFFDGQNGIPFQLAGIVHPSLRTALLIREFLNKREKTLEIRVGGPVSSRKLREFKTDAERIDYLRLKTYVLANRDRERKRLVPFTPAIVRLPVRRSPAKLAADVVPPTDPALMEEELAALSPAALLDSQGDNYVYLSSANAIPNIVREIGRLREITFRQTGEGTGRALDLDEFDNYYLHLFIWNRGTREVVGAYRLGPSDLIMRNFGRRGFYTSTLFAYRRAFLHRITPAVEMGRSFVRIEYQKSYAPLLLLWRGIGVYVSRNPQYKILFGPVSISNDYMAGSKQLMVQFLKQYCRADDLARFVRARSPFRMQPLKGWDEETGAQIVWDIENLSALIADIETDKKGIPILLKQYLKLGGRFVSFNVDSDFSNALDGLIVVDLLKTDKRVLERYLGNEGTARFLQYHEALAGAGTLLAG